MNNATLEKAEPAARAVLGWFLGIITLPIILGVIRYRRGMLIPLVIAPRLIILINALIHRTASVRIFG